MLFRSNDGAARILHLDKNGKFINQWYGNSVGQGKFTMAHGFAVDPKTGDVYVGDREEYRIVVDFGDPSSFLAVQNIGNSGVPGNPHYSDQFEPWLRGEYHTVQLRRDRVEADCESTTIIQPT